MERRLRREEVMTIEVLHERGMSNRAIARQLGIHENAVRYRLGRLASGAVDGRSGKVHSAEPWAEAIARATPSDTPPLPPPPRRPANGLRSIWWN